MRHGTAILLVLSLGGHALHAQALVPGARVRITSRQYSLNGRVGKVLSERADTIVVRFNGLTTVHYRQVWADDTLTLARNAIDRFEVSGGSKRQTKQGALLGLGIGAGVGLIAGVASYKGCQPQDELQCAMELGPFGSALGGAMGGGVLGAAVGALVGTMLRTQEWVTVTPHGVGLAISF